MELIQDKISEVSNNSDTALGRLKSVFKVQIMLVHKNKDFFKVIASQLWGKELRQFELRNKIESYINDMDGLIDDAVRSNQIKKGNSRVMAYSFIGNICSSSIYKISNNDENMDDLVEYMMEYILSGMGIQ